MSNHVSSISILMADDDEEDCLMTQQDLLKNNILSEINFVHDGEELLKYLHNEAPYEESPRPGFVLLEMNMPLLDGKGALQKIKADPELCSIPIIALTSSRVEEEIFKSHNLDVDAYLAKPINCERLIKVMQETAITVMDEPCL